MSVVGTLPTLARCWSRVRRAQQSGLSPCHRTILYAFARFLRGVGAVGLSWLRAHHADPPHHRRAACFRTTEHVIASKLLNPVSQDLDTGAAAVFSFRTDFEPGRPPTHIVGGLSHYGATQSSTLIFRGEVAGRKSRLRKNRAGVQY